MAVMVGVYIIIQLDRWGIFHALPVHIDAQWDQTFVGMWQPPHNTHTVLQRTFTRYSYY